MIMAEGLHVFVVGLPASGKSTLCRLLRERIPSFAHASDLDALHTMAHVHERAATVSSDTGLNSATSLCSPVVTYDREGRLKFDDPEVWDEALRRAYRAAEHFSNLLFEFSRGSDETYKSRFAIGDGRVYARSFGIIEQCTSRQVRRVVVHLACAADVAKQRNRRRRALGHALSSEVMNASYAHDPLQNSRASDNCGAVVAGSIQRWKMLSINSAQLPPDEVAGIAGDWIEQYR
jgi:gluconate kinase